MDGMACGNICDFSFDSLERSIWYSPNSRTNKNWGLFELTGFLAPIGKEAQQGALIALEQIGGKLMGRPVEFVLEDSATDVNISMDKMSKPVEVDKGRIIVG